MQSRFEYLGFLIKYILKFKKFFVISFLLAVFLTLMQLPMPLASKYLIDKLIPQKNIKFINILGFALTCYVIISALTWVVYTYLTSLFRLKVLNLIKYELFEKILRLPLISLEKKEAGYVASRISDEVLKLSSIVGKFFSSLVINFLTLVVGVTGVFLIHRRLALIVYTILPIYLLFSRFFNKRIYEKSLTVREVNAQNKKLLIDFLNNIMITKIYNAADFLLNKYQKSLHEVLEKEMQFTLVNSLAYASARIISSLAPLTLLWYGSLEIVKGKLTLGGLVAFNSFIGYIFSPAQQILNTVYQFQDARSSIKRIREIFGLEEEEGGKLKRKIRGEIEVINLNFSYGDRIVFRNFNLKVEPGEMVGITGPSGIGKTTLLKILAGLYPVGRGEIFIDGIDINDYDREYLRENVIYISQTPNVFAMSLLENLTLGEEYDRNYIINTLSMAGADFVGSLKYGLLTKCQEKGSNFSGGQLQRINLARGLLRKPKILLLDEVTAHVDSKTEEKIFETLMKMKGHTTILFVAHRLISHNIFDKIVNISQFQEYNGHMS